MPLVQPFVVLVLCLMSPGPAEGAPPAPSAVIVKTSAGAMAAVARLIIEDTWSPLLDSRVQEAPAGRALGAAWTPSDPRWQNARTALGARMGRILDAYARSNEIPTHIDSAVRRIGPGPDLDAAIAALNGPSGAALVRQEAKSAFVVNAMSANPNGPKAGTPEWTARLRELSQHFDQRAGGAMPADDGTHMADLQKFLTGPEHRALSRVWSLAIDNATRQLTTAMNFMLFDDQAAIDRDIAAAIGQKSGAVRTAPAAAAFDLERLATCQDSWFEWKDDQARMMALAQGLRASYHQQDETDAYFVPNAKTTMAGLPVKRVFPESIGMGVGFSVIVDASFDVTRKAVERVTHRTLTKCETGDEMRTCGLELDEKKTLTLLGDPTGKSNETLVGCYYFYEK